MKRLQSLGKKVLATLILMCLVSLGMPQLASPVLAGGVVGPCVAPVSNHFIVTITNISDESDTPTPFAPGISVLHEQPGPLFTSGQPAGDYGLEVLAEDGNPGELAESIRSMGSHPGVFSVPDGADGPGPLLPGHSYSF